MNSVVMPTRWRTTLLLLALLALDAARCMTGALPGWHMVSIAILFGIVAHTERAWASLHLAFFIVAAAAASQVPVTVMQVSFVWLSLGFVLSSALLWPVAPIRSSLRTWLRRGRLDGVAWILVLVTPLCAGAALIAWAQWTDNLGMGKAMVEDVAQLPTWLVWVIGLPLFALLNAAAEELLYRGLLQQALLEALGKRAFVVLPLQAAGFAAMHYLAGFPNGAVGFAMVFVWGLVLGELRRRTLGMCAPYVVHVAADLVIGGYLLWQL